MLRQYFFRFKFWLRRNERIVSSIALIGGFLIDNLTLQRIDLLFENLILLSYIVVAGGAIILINLYHAGKITGRVSEWVKPLSIIAMQFAFGGLFSGFLIFYSRSASFGTSWFFILILSAIFLANEFLKGYFARLSFQVSLFFLALFSYAIFLVPIVTKRIGAVIFILSGILSLVLIYLFLRLLRLIIPVIINEHKKAFVWSIGSIFLIVNAFYFLNIIPPIPLSLEDVGVYHFVGRQGNDYVLLEEKREWYQLGLFYETAHVTPGESLYVFSSIFAPTELSTDIIHEWLYFDENNRRWVSTGEIRFPIIGGRDRGYRAFSEKTQIFPGFWRVDIKTPRGQTVGRIKFNIEEVSETPELETVIQ